MKKVIGIYVIKCMGNQKVYVGSSNNIGKRWSNHISLLKNNKHCNKELQLDFNLYGIDKISFRIKEECIQKDLYETELKYFKRYNPEELYNCKGINNTKKKIRRGKEAAIYKLRRSLLMTGENNPNCTKLNVEKVKEIKTLICDGIDLQEIADRYNTTKGYIYSISKGYKWASVNIDENEEDKHE